MTGINKKIEEVEKLYGIVADELSQFIDEFKVDVRKPHRWNKLSADKKAYWRNIFSQLFPQPLDDSGITCPFCGATDFDLTGLKYHLRNYCEAYRKTEVFGL